MTVRRKVLVHGLVQGVGFRFAVARAAETRGVTGWVRNRADGTVEAVFEGEPEAVASMVAYSEQGPRGAVVERVDVEAERPAGERGFAVR
jgi:acylphosphatase